MIYKQSEWQSSTGSWHCNCVDNLGKDSGAWYLPARILGLAPADFLKLLLTKYKPDNFYFNKEKCFCSWSWNSQAAMRKYKNDINAAARAVKFEI